MSLTKKEERKLSKLTETEAKNIQALLDFIDCVKLADDDKEDMPEPHVGDKIKFPGVDMEAYIGNTFDDGSVLFYSTGVLAGEWNELFEEKDLSTILTLAEHGYIKANDHDIRKYIRCFKGLKGALLTDSIWIPKIGELEKNPVAIKALAEAANNICSFKNAGWPLAWLGTPYGSSYAYSVYSDGGVDSYYRSGSFVVAPAFIISDESLQSLWNTGKIKWEDETDDD